MNAFAAAGRLNNTRNWIPNINSNETSLFQTQAVRGVDIVLIGWNKESVKPQAVLGYSRLVKLYLRAGFFSASAALFAVIWYSLSLNIVFFHITVALIIGAAVCFSLWIVTAERERSTSQQSN
ncbi:MAG: hypothetical protein ABI230_02240 [Aestuariivirga sp.]